MVRFRFALLLVPFLAGCYSDRLPPPNFRHACGSDSDCRDIERCISGLCQRPCTQSTADEDCPSDDGFATCFNGVCVSTCELPPEDCSGESAGEVCERPELQGTCSSPHKCLDLGFALDVGGGFFGGGTDVALGVCAEWCTEDSCPSGEICFERFCVAMCDPLGPDTCNQTFGLMCHPDLALCLPEDIFMSTTGSTTDPPTSTTQPMTTEPASSTMEPATGDSTMGGT